MTNRGIADDVQLATLTRILDEYCEQAGIEGSHPAREHLARRLIALFSGGIDSQDEIWMALDGIAKDYKPGAIQPRLGYLGCGPHRPLRVLFGRPPRCLNYGHISN